MEAAGDACNMHVALRAYSEGRIRSSLAELMSTTGHTQHTESEGHWRV